MMQTAFQQLIWGFLLVFLNFNIIFVDILPDFIGFMLILSSLKQLEKQSAHFGKAKPFAFVMIFYSIPTFFGKGGIGIANTTDFTWILYDQIAHILLLFIVYWICQGIAECADKLDLHTIEKQAKHRWNLLFIVSICYLVLEPFTLNVSILTNIMVLLLVLFLLSIILFLALLFRAKNQFSDNARESV